MKRVSIIIPTYKGVDTIERSIRSALDSTYPNIEVIVVDDNGSHTEMARKTEQIVSQWRREDVKYVSHSSNRNGAVARNTGINMATGEIVTFLDDDDYILPDRVEKSVQKVEEGCDIVFANVCIVRYGLDYRIHEMDPGLNYKNLLYDELSVGTGSNIFLKKSIVESIGGFDEAFERFQDREFLIRALKDKQVGIIPEILIIKGNNNQDNRPTISGRIRMEKIFEKKFEDEIALLSLEQKKTMKINNAHFHFEYYIRARDREHAFKEYKFIAQEHSLKKTEMMVYGLVRLGIDVNNPFCNWLKKTYIRIFNIEAKRRVKANVTLWNFIKKNELGEWINEAD